MSRAELPTVERIIANTINETARGDRDALAARIVAALGEAGYRIVPANGMEDTALGPQPFDEVAREMRPQDTYGDGRDWTFKTSEHGGDEPDNMPQAIEATDAQGRWAIYVPLTRGGKIVVPRPSSAANAKPSRRDPDKYRMEQLYRSPNGDTWFLARDPATGLGTVRHQANASSGGQVTDLEIGAFLNGPMHPEQEALLRVIGASIIDTHGTAVDDEPPAADARREWSDAELTELGNMLVRGLSIEEIARVLRRDHRDIRDKVAEVGRACR
jgi:hypothetical protein